MIRAVAFLSLFCINYVSADMYKCPSSSGAVVFSDKECVGGYRQTPNGWLSLDKEAEAIRAKQNEEVEAAQSRDRERFLQEEKEKAEKKKKEEEDKKYLHAKGYKILFSYKAGFNWTVVQLAPGIDDKKLIEIAQLVYSEIPRNHVRFFDDSEYIDQFVKRDMWFNGTSQSEVAFPADWAKSHHRANIHDRSYEHPSGKWQVVTRGGNVMKVLD
jgi:hypothetical protein